MSSTPSFEASRCYNCHRLDRTDPVRYLAGSFPAQREQPAPAGLIEHAAWHLGRTVSTILRNRRWPTAALTAGGARSSATGSRRSDLTGSIRELEACDPRGFEMAGVEVIRANTTALPPKRDKLLIIGLSAGRSSAGSNARGWCAGIAREPLQHQQRNPNFCAAPTFCLRLASRLSGFCSSVCFILQQYFEPD